MSAVFDDSQGALFASAVGLIVFFGLVLAIPVVSIILIRIKRNHLFCFGFLKA